MTQGTEKVYCGACRHFEPSNEDLLAGDQADDPEMGHLGTCVAMDNVALPHAWRYAVREVMGAWSLEKIQCTVFQGKEPNQ
jgi:hypothetical protein